MNNVKNDYLKSVNLFRSAILINELFDIPNGSIKNR